MALKKSQRSLKSWTKQKWRTKSGKPSAKTGERYLPSAAIKSLSPAEYAATTRAKRKGTKAGKQHVAQPKKTMGTAPTTGMSEGGQLKDIPAGNKGLGKLPAAVRNKMGFKNRGGMISNGAKDYRKSGMFYKG